MRDEIAIVEPAQLSFVQMAAGVRAAASALREADAQVEKAERRAEGARDAQARRRLDLGRALIAIRSTWKPSGPQARGWGEFLEAEGIPSQRASEYMRLAGYVQANPPAIFEDAGESEAPVPTQAEAGIRGGRADEQPDPPAQQGLPVVLSGFDLRHGRWEDTLADIGVVDALIFDAPFSARTHESHAERYDGRDPTTASPTYDQWSPEDVDAFVAAWAPRCRGWMVALSDDVLAPAWRAAYAKHGRRDFAPVPCVINGMTVRLAGDGPSSWAVYAMVSRPSDLARWGTLPGAYVGGREAGAGGGRGKPSWLMDAIVGDYTRAGDLVCDPLAGYGSTLIAAAKLGRRAIGAEVDAAAHTEAIARASVALAQQQFTAADEPHNQEGNVYQ